MIVIATVSSVATGIYLPSMPAIRHDLHSSNSLVQLTLTLYFIAFASQIIYGPPSERFGRRKIALLGLFLSFFGSVLCVFSPDIYLLLFGRFLQGLAVGALVVLSRAIMRDVFSGEQLSRLGSIVSMSAAAVTAGVPALGGYIQRHLDWRVNFLVIVLYALLGLVMVWRWLPETIHTLEPSATKCKVALHNYLHLLKCPIFIGYAITSSLAFGGFAAYLAASPFLLEDVLGLSPVQYGWTAVLLAGMFALGGGCNSFLIKFLGRHRMLVIGVLIHLLGSLLMLLPALLGYLSLVAILAPMSFYVLGAGITLPNAFAGALHPYEKIAGFSGALYGLFQILGGALTTLITAFVHERNQIPLGSILVVVSVCAYCFQYLAFRYSVRSKFH